MNKSLRVYLESIVNLAIATTPDTLSDQGLIGVVGLLQTPAVGYAEWSEKTGIGKDVEETPDQTPEEMNDQFIEHCRLMGLKDGNGNTE